MNVSLADFHTGIKPEMGKTLLIGFPMMHPFFPAGCKVINKHCRVILHT